MTFTYAKAGQADPWYPGPATGKAIGKTFASRQGVVLREMTQLHGCACVVVWVHIPHSKVRRSCISLESEVVWYIFRRVRKKVV
jgi:hypothetical protein